MKCDAVLFDRDGTLIQDVPYNGDPDKVDPIPGARNALDRIRRAGIAVGIVTNQSGLAKHRFTAAELRAVHQRVESLLGPFDVVVWCPHDETDGCGCRKPRPGLVVKAARALAVDRTRCVVVGDTAADVDAARAAGAVAILVPNDRTLHSEVAAAPVVAADITTAVDMILGER